MKRNIVDKLIQWKNEWNTDTGKPLLLTGLKGVGKTYLAYDFAKAFFERISYVNFEHEPGREDSIMIALSDIDQRKDNLRNIFGIVDEPIQNQLLILDEISFTKDFITMLEGLQASGIFLYILCISSNPVSEEILSISYHVPVFPIEFDEFLLATSNEWYIEAIKNHFDANKKIPDIVHKELLSLFDLYLKIGGMPSAINEYLNLNSIINVPEQHEKLTGIYHDILLRNCSESDALKMIQVFDSIPTQLEKENKKFQFRQIRKGTTYSMYKAAIDYLTASEYIIKCMKIGDDQLSVIGNSIFLDDAASAESNFKLYFPDTGLLSTKMPFILNSDTNLYKGLLENYTAQSLHRHGCPLYFWESGSMAKIDFLIQKSNKDLIPIEIHTSENTRSKCINVFKNKYPFPYALKISSRNFKYENQIKYVPYYSIFCL